jgi:FAD binding domain
MRRVEVDGEARIARSEGGATWLDFDTATQAFGRVTPGGVVGSTGVAGLTFGGGIGHLTAQHGLTMATCSGVPKQIAEKSIRQSDRHADLTADEFQHRQPSAAPGRRRLESTHRRHHHSNPPTDTGPRTNPARRLHRGRPR